MASRKKGNGKHSEDGVRDLPKRTFFVAKRKGCKEAKLCYVGRVEIDGKPVGPWIVARFDGFMAGAVRFRPTSLNGGKIIRYDRRPKLLGSWRIWMKKGEGSHQFG